MKKIVSSVIVLVMLLSVIGIFASCEKGPSVHVTVYDGKSVVVVDEKVAIEEGKTDDLNSVFKAINEKHGKKFETETTEFGLSITCFWDIANGGSYGYYVNDAMSMGLTDKVKDGDHVYVFVYSDTTAWSDKYSFFDKHELTVKKGESVTLTLKYIDYDESWNPVALPLANATVTLDGVAVNAKTDAEGKITFTASKSGVISATTDEMTLVPPVCVLTVK